LSHLYFILSTHTRSHSLSYAISMLSPHSILSYGRYVISVATTRLTATSGKRVFAILVFIAIMAVMTIMTRINWINISK